MMVGGSGSKELGKEDGAKQIIYLIKNSCMDLMEKIKRKMIK